MHTHTQEAMHTHTQEAMHTHTQKQENTRRERRDFRSFWRLFFCIHPSDECVLFFKKKKEIDDEKAWPWQFECPEFFVRAKQREATRVKFQRQNLSAPTYSPHFTFFFRALNEALARVCPPEDDSASTVLFPCFFLKIGAGLSLSLFF